jgi:hypothetical protein
MKTVKARLTELKNLINTKINKDYAWMGEIKSPEIIKEIERLYPLIEKIEKSGKTLEISYAKYISLQLIKKIIRILNKSNEWDEYDENSFILSLIKLRMTIKELYLIEVKGELRTEEELNAIAADISKAKLNLKEHISLEEQLVEDKKELENLKNSLITLKKSYNDAQEQITEISQWHEQSEKLSGDISSYEFTAQNNLTKITTLSTTAETNKPKIEKYHEDIEDMIKLFNKQKEEIQMIIEDANRASMAGSFKTQSENIDSKMKAVDKILLGSLVATSAISFSNYSTSLSATDSLNILQFLAKSVVTIPLLVIAWLKAKERAYLFRLREDYNYKYSSAMAFEGYKKQVQEQDPKLHQQLLQIAVDNLGINPTKVFDKDLKSTPLETIIDGVEKRLDKAVDGIKGEVNNIPKKTKELIDDE